jgi:hypothetical protein
MHRGSFRTLLITCCLSLITPLYCAEEPILSGFALVDSYSDDNCAIYLGTTRYPQSVIEEDSCKQKSVDEVSVFEEHAYSTVGCGRQFANITVTVGIQFPDVNNKNMGVLIPPRRAGHAWKPNCRIPGELGYYTGDSSAYIDPVTPTNPFGSQCVMYHNNVSMAPEQYNMRCKLSMLETNKCIKLNGWSNLIDPSKVVTNSAIVRCSIDMDRVGIQPISNANISQLLSLFDMSQPFATPKPTQDTNMLAYIILFSIMGAIFLIVLVYVIYNGSTPQPQVTVKPPVVLPSQTPPEGGTPGSETPGSGQAQYTALHHSHYKRDHVFQHVKIGDFFV